MSEGAPKAGDVLGSYILRSVLGTGGMGIVYLAEHQRLKRKVALKLLRPELMHDAVALQRFFAEARAVNEIGHDNIVEITDFVEEGPHRYFVMELLKGRGLDEIMKEKRLPLPRVAHIAQQIAEALAAAHDSGVVHRDMKPQNVFLVKRGRDFDFVKLLDFGIAKMQDAPSDEVVKTQPGLIVGTPAYLSPEQIEKPPGDHRVDVYSFGVLLFEMTTGRRPFQGSMVELLRAHLFSPVPKPSLFVEGCPPLLDELITWCLKKAPAERPQSMHDVADLLGELTEQVGPARYDDPSDSGEWAVSVTGGYKPAPIDFIDDDDIVEVPAEGERAVPAQREAPKAIELAPSAAAAAPSHLNDQSSGNFMTPMTLPKPSSLEEEAEDALPPFAPPKSRAPLAIAAGVVAAVLLGVVVMVVLGGEEEAPAPVAVAPEAEPPPQPSPPTEPAPEQQEPAAPADVTVELESTPPGATVSVRVGDDDVPLGVTPLKAELAADIPMLITMKHAGYQPWSKQLVAKAGDKVVGTLIKIEPAAKPIEKKAPPPDEKKSLKEGAIKNPFAKKK